MDKFIHRSMSNMQHMHFVAQYGVYHPMRLIQHLAKFGLSPYHMFTRKSKATGHIPQRFDSSFESIEPDKGSLD